MNQPNNLPAASAVRPPCDDDKYSLRALHSCVELFDSWRDGIFRRLGVSWEQDPPAIAMARSIAQRSLLRDPELDPTAVLRDLKAWMAHRLQYGPIKHQRPDDDHYPQNQHPNGYTGVIIPDWEMRQKLATVTESLAQGTSADVPPQAEKADKR